MTGMDGCRMNGSGWLFPGGGVATPHGASHEEDGSFPWEGPVPSVSHMEHQQQAVSFFTALTRRLP